MPVHHCRSARLPVTACAVSGDAQGTSFQVTLPGAQGQTPLTDGHIEGGAHQAGLDMRGHVIIPATGCLTCQGSVSGR